MTTNLTTWLFWASAIAVGVALGRELGWWLKFFTADLHYRVNECARGDRPWSALFNTSLHYADFKEWRVARGR